VEGFQRFAASLVDPSTGVSRVDLVLACVDNYEVRVQPTPLYPKP